MFDLDRKLNSWLKFQPNFLARLPYAKKMTTIYLLFLGFIQFSAIEIRLVFRQAKFMISRLQCLEKKLGCPCSLVSYSHFSTDRAQYQGKSAMVLTCTCTGALNDAINYAQKGRAVQMRGLSLSGIWCFFARDLGTIGVTLTTTFIFTRLSKPGALFFFSFFFSPAHFISFLFVRQ